MGVWWCVSVRVSTRERNQFPSALFQPLGHQFRVREKGRLRAPHELVDRERWTKDDESAGTCRSS
jgi:hypothetical protein